MIHQVRIQNFKSLIDVKIDLMPITVLVGKSGTGKTNFIEAIRVLRDILSSQPGWPSVNRLQQQWSESRPIMASEAKTSFEVEFSITGLSHRYLYRLIVAHHGIMAPVKEEMLQLGDSTLFHHADSKWLTPPEVVHVPKAGPVLLGRIPAISEISDAHTALTMGIGCYTFPNGVLANDPTRTGAGGFGSGVAIARGHRSPTVGLDDQGANYLDAVKGILVNLNDLSIRDAMIESLREVNPSVSSMALDDIHHATQVVVGHKSNGKTVSLKLAQESEGFRRFYAYLLALYQRPPKQTLLFEHPEDGIHPGALSMLADELRAAPADDRGQVLLTTHSPTLLDHFETAEIRVVELENLQTRIRPVSGEQCKAIQEHLLDPGELLTVDPARGQASTEETAGV